MKEMLQVIRKFNRYLMERKGLYVLFLILVISTSIFSGIIPYFYKQFVEALPENNTQQLLTILYVFVGVRVFEEVLSTASFYVGDVISFPAGIKARVEVFKQLHELDFAFHGSKSTGSLISIIKRGDGAFFSLYFAIYHRIFRVIVGFIVMAYFFSSLDSLYVLLVGISFIVSVIAMKYIVRYNIRTRKEFNEEEDVVTGIIVDNIINFDTVKLFAKEQWEQKRLEKAFVVWKQKLWEHGLSFRVLDISIGGILNVSIFVLLYIGLKQYSQKNLDLGDFVLILGFVNSFFPRLFDLFFGFRDIAKNFEDITKYFGILEYDVEIKDTEKPTVLKNIEGEVEFKNVSFSYKGGKDHAIKNLSLKVRPGQSIALVGRSGSGKTTLTKLLMRFYDLDKGQITIDGVPITNFTKSYLRSLMGSVPQDPIMFNNTIGYNIGYGRTNATKKEIVAAAKLANLHDFIESLPEKYKTNVGERGIKLSGGQKQRLAIARMILSNPDIIIFDEATSQLDSENEKLIQDAFWEASENKTTFIIAHRLSTAMRADKIIVMEDGKIIEEGSHKELLMKDSLYKYFWELQTTG